MSQTIVYTDGSYHPQLKIGTWAAIILLDDEQILLEGSASQTTNNRMELQAVIEVLKYFQIQYQQKKELTFITDSQFVIGLQKRKETLISNDFITKSGKILQNADIIREFYEISKHFSTQFVKIKAHQKEIPHIQNLNIEVDKIVRKNLRALINK